MDIPTVQEFLEMLTGPVGWAMLATFFSVMYEKMSWFQKLAANWKQIIMIASSVLVSAVSYVLMTYVPTDVFALIAPYWLILYGTIGTWTSSQVAHSILNTSGDLIIENHNA